MKSQGSCKIGGHCTSTLKLTERVDCNELELYICKTHYGHQMELGHLRISKTDKMLIGCKRKMGVDKQRIIADIQGSIGELHRQLFCSCIRTCAICAPLYMYTNVCCCLAIMYI